MADLSIYDNDPTLYLFTSLTAGSSHIVTATSRIETILRANKIPFKGVDTATDELARKLYGRRASGKKLPLLVKEGYVLGDLEEIEEWNEYGELKEALGVTSTPAPAKPAATSASTSTPATSSTTSSTPQTQAQDTPAATTEQNLTIRQLGAEAAKAAAAKKPTPGNIKTTNPLLSEKVNSPAASAGGATPKMEKSMEGILSPRSIPLPTTPGLGKEDSAKEVEGTEEEKEKEEVEAEGAAGQRRHSGAEVKDASTEEVKKVEKAQAIVEESESEEEDEDEDEDEDEAEEEEKAKESAAKSPEAETPAAATAVEAKEKDKTDDKATEKTGVKQDKPDATVKPQEQDPKDGDKAGESVMD